jgi:hypothetical protein
MTGTTPIVTNGKGQSSTNYQPIFSIVKWVDRPAELDAPKAAPVAANEARAQPVTQARTTSQVAPAPAEDDEEF